MLLLHTPVTNGLALIQLHSSHMMLLSKVTVLTHGRSLILNWEVRMSFLASLVHEVSEHVFTRLPVLDHGVLCHQA